jgi:signal peptidase I
MTNSSPQRLIPSGLNHFWADCRLRFSWAWFFRQCCSLTRIIVLGALCCFLVSHFIFEPVRVSGQSMSPTLLDTGSYWLNRWVYLEHEPKRADIVAVKDPQDGGLVVKRIVALPGESIYFKNGAVYVNGRRLDEFYLPSHTPTYAYEKNEDELLCCGKDQYFVLGDNRGNSTDSRTFGAVPRRDILGKVVP